MTQDDYVIDNPYAPPAQENDVYLEPDRGGSLMKMGIVGAVFLGMFPIVSIILGAVCWGRAKRDLELMAAGKMSMEGGARAKTKAGFILAKINVIVGPFAIISLILYIWAQVETMRF